MNIYDLISRAQKLRKETQLDSVSPDRVGGLHEDTLKYINEFQLLASSPSLHKIYASVSAMQSDKSPKSDLTGKPLKPGQLVVIVPANQTDATAGDVYRYDGPSGNTSAWTFVAKIGAVPADAELSATSTNPPQNKVVTEKLTELESKVVEITEFQSQFVDGKYAITNRNVGGSINVTEVADSARKRIKLNVKAGEQYRITGTGGGADVVTESKVETDLASSMLNGRWEMSSDGIGSVVSANKVWDGTWRSLQYSVKAGEQYRITGTGGLNGRLYALLDSNNVLQAIAPSNYVQTDFVLNVTKNGTLYCSFLKANAHSVIKIETNTTTSNNNALLYCVTDSNGIVKALAAADEVSIDKPLVIIEDGFLYANFEIGKPMSLKKTAELKPRIASLETDVIRLDNNILLVEERVDENTSDNKKIKNYLGYQQTETDLASFMLNGRWELSSYNVGTSSLPEKVWDGTWRSLQYSVKAGEQYRITGTGGLNGRLYALLDSYGILQVVAPSYDVQTDFILNVTKDGTLYCSFLSDNTHSVIKIEESFKEQSIKEWKNGSFEFGRTCDCDYTAPTIARWSYPEEGQRVKAINAYYDELMAEFPLYISKVDCDATMAALGVAKPDAIKDSPMYMYQFLPPRTPENSTTTSSVVNRIKAMILTGTHPEYMSVWDMINTMRLVCRSWKENKNLEELRWNADIYIIPCLNLYACEHGTRPNENGVDINRNAPTSDWTYQGVGTIHFSGDSPASEYSTKAFMHFLDLVKPDVFIDHHATNVGSGDDEGDGKNMMYVHSTEKLAIDIGGVCISQMTRKWKERYSDTFPTNDEDPTTIFGFSRNDDLPGSLSKYATEQGAFGSTYESNYGILYKNKQYGVANRQTNTELVATCATEGFINYLVRTLKVYSEMVGVVA